MEGVGGWEIGSGLGLREKGVGKIEGGWDLG